MNDTLHIQRRRAQVGRGFLAYEVAGTGSPVVLIHGLSGSSRWWSRNIHALAQRHQVYALDLIGFGESRCGHPFVLSEAANIIAQWMDGIGIERASVIGHSMGGLIAAELAADHPERVARLALVDPAAHPFDLRLFGPPSMLLQAMRYLPLNFLTLLVSDAYKAGPSTLLSAILDLFTTDIRHKLSAISAATMLVWGEHDVLVPLSLGMKLREYLPHARFVVMKAAGHNPMIDRPEAFNRLIGDFLDDAPAQFRVDLQQEQRRLALAA
ncbi:MAG TPA: alpha/beta fold hydrolase [Roseiflexaceae bacterium]|nr:alpha/beta fold hydrolase [Roseiflexaceae bacterium]